MKNKRGLSDVITTVLIILLALAAVGIIWAFIKPTIENTAGGIDLNAQCFNTDVKPTKCTYNKTTDKATVIVQLTRGEADEVIAILELDDGTTQIKNATSPSLLGTVQITFDLATITAIPVRANAAAKISDNRRNSRTCDPSPTIADCTS